MSTIWHEVPGEEFSGDAFVVSGVAFYDVTVSRAYDADIGGIDGMEVDDVELTEFRLDGLKLTRTQMVEAAGESAIESAEDRVAEDFRMNPEMMEG